MNPTLLENVRAWMAEDPDEETREELARLLAASDEQGLADRFRRRLAFGTAGLRGELGAGPNRMNRVLVRKVTSGLADYVAEQVHNARARGVVIGFDGRKNSDIFARDAADVLRAKGFRVYLADDVIPTPGLAYGVLALNTAAGIMVTASHNPPKDNGYKVYWENGAQIIPPHDHGIAAAIDHTEVPSVGERPGVESIPEAVIDGYFEDIARLRVHKSTGAIAVYTAMHGVGREFVERAVTEAGHVPLHVVAEQGDPDPNFSTVAFPNPEEKGALDLAKALASKVGADLVLANDPDADRLAVALPDASGTFVSLTGNQVGVLLGHDLLVHGPRSTRPLLSNSVVSSVMLESIARANQAEFVSTLTGFKWIANAAMAHEETGDSFVLGYEEALGYCAGSVVRDKDGVSALLLLLDLASWLKSQGKTLWDQLQALYEAHGLYVNEQVAIKLPGEEGAARIANAMDTLRASPPSSLGGIKVVRFEDVLNGRWVDASGETGAASLPSSNLLCFDLQGGSRVLVRPSGTEPKIKFYFEARVPLDGGRAFLEVEPMARAVIEDLKADILQKSGLDGY